MISNISDSATLQGRTAVITGGAGGLGRAIAARYAAAGAKIAILDHPAALAQADLPADWAAYDVDLAAPEAQARLSAIATTIENASVLVANAGVVPPWRSVEVLEAEEWHRVMTINVWGVAASISAFSNQLKTAGNGAVIIMSSINGYRPSMTQMLYTASKHAAIGVMKAAAQELGASGVRVNALAPGPIATPALLGRIERRHATGGPAPEDALKAFGEATWLKRIATSQNVADAALFLASDAAAAITGLVMPVECGLE